MWGLATAAQSPGARQPHPAAPPRRTCSRMLSSRVEGVAVGSHHAQRRLHSRRHGSVPLMLQLEVGQPLVAQQCHVAGLRCCLG